jgi:hypothetical protein
MSLVNDALRRAKEADKAAPPPPPQLQFRPAEPGQPARQNPALMVPAVLAVVGMLALLLLWQWTQGRKGADVQQARALTPAAVPAISAAPPGPPAPTKASAPAEQPGLVQKAPGVPAPAAPVANATPTDPTTAAALADKPAETTNAVAALPIVAPKPPPLRLQAIVYNPKRPSALINGKTLFIGEKLGDAKVVAIDQESATLLSGGKTTVLTLPE